MNKNYLFISVIIFISFILFVDGCSITNKLDIQENGNLFEDIRNANTIAWIGPHPDDEIWVSGLLAYVSLGYYKETYVISLNKKAYSTSPGTPEDRLVDNQDFKDFMGLKDYVYFEESAEEYTGNLKERFFAFLDNFISESDLDLIITFENTNGANGHPDHIQLSEWLTDYSKKNSIKLYYYISRNPINTSNEPDPLPVTDTIDLDEHYITSTDNKRISLWDAKVEVIKIYSSSVPGANRLTQNPEIAAEAIHEENYRRVNF